MKLKVGIVIIAAICVGLLIALIATKKSADDQVRKNADTILQFSNELTSANANLDDLRQVNLMLTNDLAASREILAGVSNNLTETSGTLAQTKASLQTAQDEISNLNNRINDLEAQNQALDERAATLTNNIAQLDAQIAATMQKLASSETNNALLAEELQKQMAEKAEMERKFNDLAQVREQVKKLRDELFVARRLEWMAAGYTSATPQKGAELLKQGAPMAAPANADAAKTPRYDLNVEVGSDGSVHVIPPPTNAPAH
jgi:predicted nuclease with TOPRIM domain